MTDSESDQNDKLGSTNMQTAHSEQNRINISCWYRVTFCSNALSLDFRQIPSLQKYICLYQSLNKTFFSVPINHSIGNWSHSNGTIQNVPNSDSYNQSSHFQRNCNWLTPNGVCSSGKDLGWIFYEVEVNFPGTLYTENATDWRSQLILCSLMSKTDLQKWAVRKVSSTNQAQECKCNSSNQEYKKMQQKDG